MRKGILLALVLSFIVLGAGVTIFAAWWLTPAADIAADVSSTEVGATVNNASSVDTAPSAETFDMVESSEEEMVTGTYASQKPSHFCNGKESASTGY